MSIRTAIMSIRRDALSSVPFKASWRRAFSSPLKIDYVNKDIQVMSIRDSNYVLSMRKMSIRTDILSFSLFKAS